MSSIVELCNRAISLSEKATPGPWASGEDVSIDCGVCTFDGKKGIAETRLKYSDEDVEANAKIIAFSRNHIAQMAKALKVALGELSMIASFEGEFTDKNGDVGKIAEVHLARKALAEIQKIMGEGE